MTVAIIGIAGVGKEHARVLTELGAAPTVIVDFEEVLKREVQPTPNGGLHVVNKYPGFEFDLTLHGKPHLLPLEAAHSLHSYGITHAILAAPPTRAGRALLPSLVDQGIKVLVEKPLKYFQHDARNQALPGVSVNYHYGWADSREFSVVEMTCPYPDAMSWRWSIGSLPILWDIGVHALSVLSEMPETPNVLHVSPDRIVLEWESENRRLECSYLAPGEGHGGMRLDGVEISWADTFRKSEIAFLEGRHNSLDRAVELELWAEKFEGGV